jgi:TonB family protein
VATRLRINRVVAASEFVALILLSPHLAAAQSHLPSYDDAYVLRATPRQTTPIAPLTLTFSGRFLLGKKQLKEFSITIPSTDVSEPLTTWVRTNAGSGFPYRESKELLFVLDVRSRNIPETTSSSFVFTLASGIRVMIPPNVIHEPATMWLRSNLPSDTRPAAPEVQFDSGSTEFDSFCRELRSRGLPDLCSPWLSRSVATIRRNTSVPEEATSPGGRGRVRILVQKDGRITNVTLIESSGETVVDEAVIAGVIASSRLAPLPIAYPSPTLAWVMTFEFYERSP